jgi:hypothetical protein
MLANGERDANVTALSWTMVRADGYSERVHWAKVSGTIFADFAGRLRM